MSPLCAHRTMAAQPAGLFAEGSQLCGQGAPGPAAAPPALNEILVLSCGRWGRPAEALQCLCSHPKGVWARAGAQQLKGLCRKAARQSLAPEAARPLEQRVWWWQRGRGL
jgi:hypothetical protein